MPVSISIIVKCHRSFELILALVACSAFTSAQEIRFIDLSGVVQQTTLVRPERPRPKCDEKGCVGGGVGGASVGCGGGAAGYELTAQILEIQRQESRNEEVFVVELRLTNTGKEVLRLPIHPHLSELQPLPIKKPTFEYESFNLQIDTPAGSADGAPPSVPVVMVTLFGIASRPQTILLLKPGESLRLRFKPQAQSLLLEGAVETEKIKVRVYVRNIREKLAENFTDIATSFINTKTAEAAVTGVK